jgi:hypothetical protein
MTVAAALLAAKDLGVAEVPLDSVPATGSVRAGGIDGLDGGAAVLPGGILEPTTQDALGTGPGQSRSA